MTNHRTIAHPTLGPSYAIDIMLHASSSGTFHSRGLMYITYDTTSFGASVDFNSNLVYTEGELLDGTVNFLGQIRPKYRTINVIDNTQEIVAFTWENDWLSFPPNPMLHNEVADTLKHLYTVIFKIKRGVPDSTDVLFFTPLMQNQQYLITSDLDGDGSPDELPYGGVDVLPVELDAFEASWTENGDALISWVTWQEINHDYFILEKGYENGTFFPIQKIDGAGNSESLQQYQWVDPTAHAPVNYYRLKQVDFSGNSVYSDVIQLTQDIGPAYQVFPSPTADLFYIKASSQASPRVILSDIQGRTLNAYNPQFTSVESQMTFDLSAYPDGVYFVQIISAEGKSQSHKIVKSQF